MNRKPARIAAAFLALMPALVWIGASAGSASATVTNKPYSYVPSTGGCWNAGYTIGGATTPNVCGFPEVSGVVPTRYSSMVYRANTVWFWNAPARKWVNVSTSDWFWVDCAEQGCLGIRDFGTWWSLSNPSVEVPRGQWVITETDLYFKVSPTTWERHVLWNEYDGNGAFVAGAWS